MSSNQSQQNPQGQEQVVHQISHIQLMVNAIVLAYSRGAYTMNEVGTIWKALEYFTEQTKQAVMPIVKQKAQPPKDAVQPKQAQQPQEEKPEIKVNETKVSSVTNAGNSAKKVHTIEPEEESNDNVVLNVKEVN